mmetsp:Transcript_64134/g.165076  ORF Transcript_64134/g.165076 Transcript_64134/m.165076 type:complete len:224 (+) Transcript_64134:312-983(+)
MRSLVLSISRIWFRLPQMFVKEWPMIPKGMAMYRGLTTIRMDVSACPSRVLGVMSPYPTVNMVESTSHPAADSVETFSRGSAKKRADVNTQAMMAIVNSSTGSASRQFAKAAMRICIFGNRRTSLKHRMIGDVHMSRAQPQLSAPSASMCMSRIVRRGMPDRQSIMLAGFAMKPIRLGLNMPLMRISMTSTVSIPMSSSSAYEDGSWKSTNGMSPTAMAIMLK